MKLHEAVKTLEEDAASLADLTGEILATLEVNLQRGHLMSTIPDGIPRLAEWVRNWQNQFQLRRVSIADSGNITYGRIEAEEPK